VGNQYLSVVLVKYPGVHPPNFVPNVFFQDVFIFTCDSGFDFPGFKNEHHVQTSLEVQKLVILLGDHLLGALIMFNWNPCLVLRGAGVVAVSQYAPDNAGEAQQTLQ
jgi:hypothetical protein